MIARALIVVLGVLNLVVALWWWRQPLAAPAPLPAWPDAPRLHVLAAGVRLPATLAQPAPGIRCLRIGPFADAAQVTALRMRLPAELTPLPAVASRAGHWLHLRQQGAVDARSLDELIAGAGVAWRAEACPAAAQSAR